MKCNRREVIKNIGAIAATISVWRAGLVQAASEESPHLTTANPSAAAQGYTEDSASVDEKKFPKHHANERCAGCKLYQGSTGATYGPCSLYPGNAVNANGWCAGYIAKG